MTLSSKDLMRRKALLRDNITGPKKTAMTRMRRRLETVPSLLTELVEVAWSAVATRDHLTGEATSETRIRLLILKTKIPPSERTAVPPHRWAEEDL